MIVVAQQALEQLRKEMDDAVSQSEAENSERIAEIEKATSEAIAIVEADREARLKAERWPTRAWTASRPIWNICARS